MIRFCFEKNTYKYSFSVVGVVVDVIFYIVFYSGYSESGFKYVYRNIYTFITCECDVLKAVACVTLLLCCYARTLLFFFKENCQHFFHPFYLGVLSYTNISILPILYLKLLLGRCPWEMLNIFGRINKMKSW